MPPITSAQVGIETPRRASQARRSRASKLSRGGSASCKAATRPGQVATSMPLYPSDTHDGRPGALPGKRLLRDVPMSSRDDGMAGIEQL